MIKKLITPIALFFAALAIVLILLYSNSTAENETTNTNTGPEKATVEATSQIDLADIRYPVGESAEHTLVVYIDPQDAKSREFVNEVKFTVENMNGAVNYTIKHFPIHIHPTARDEAGAIECAGQQGKYYEYMNEVFAQSESDQAIAEAVLTQVAETLELDTTLFATCRTQEQFHNAVKDDALEAMSVGAQGVPHAVIVDSNGLVLQTIQGFVGAQPLTSAINNTLLYDEVVENTLGN